MITKLMTSEERISLLRSRLSGQTRTLSRADKRLEANRPMNLMFGASLHAAARHAKGLPLSPLEQCMMDMLRTVAGDDEVAEYGKVYTETMKSARSASNKIIPEAVLRVEEVSYTDEDLLRDTEELLPEILAMPSNAIVDVTKIGEGGCADSLEYAAAIADAGTGVIVFAAPGPATDAERVAGAQANELIPAILRMERFKCLRASGDGMFNSKDKIYWCTAAGADSQAEGTMTTPEFGSIKTNDTRSFASDTYMLFGNVIERFAGHIQVWEADDSNGGFYNSLRAMLKRPRNWRWMQLPRQLKVCERNVAWTREGLLALYDRPDREISIIFEGYSQGKHEL